MKSARTIRTLNRCGISPATVGFSGYKPTGKAIRALARQRRLEKRLLSTEEGGAAFNRAARMGLNVRQTLAYVSGRL